jgi:predicted RNA-binding Zn ribbon-like protein
MALSFARAGIAASPSSLGRWLGEAGFDPAGAEAVGLRLAEFRRLHEAVVAVLGAVVAGGAPPPPAVERLNFASAAVPFAPRLTVVDGRPAALDEPPHGDRATDVLAAIARSAIRLAGSGDAERLRRCPACGTFFVTTRPDRIWCGASCGNRARVARHHARRRGG